jgi:hypothetical protein
MLSSGNVSSLLIYLIGGIALTVILILVTRAYWCWYFKINKIERLLQEIASSLRTYRPVGSAYETTSNISSSRLPEREGAWRCTCGAVNLQDVLVCAFCGKTKPRHTNDVGSEGE